MFMAGNSIQRRRADPEAPIIFGLSRRQTAAGGSALFIAFFGPM
jgi:hypothetical protein